MKSHFDLVCEFNKAFDYKVYNLHEGNPLDNNIKDASYRYNLIHEEGIEELGFAMRKNDRVEMMDAIADLLYVLYGACYTYNLNPTNMFDCFYGSFSNYYAFTKQTNLINNENPQNIYKKLVNSITLIKKHLLETKNIIDLYSSLLNTINTTYMLGFSLYIDVNKVFNIVHESNMSKLCSTEEEAINTVNDYIMKRNIHNKYYEEYKNKYGQDAIETQNVYCPYDSPYYYKPQNSNYYLVKNKSTGKALKNINYKPVKL
jgi:predicted HAD superfamily Cof-like phosphohydrolase